MVGRPGGHVSAGRGGRRGRRTCIAACEALERRVVRAGPASLIFVAIEDGSTEMSGVPFIADVEALDASGDPVQDEIPLTLSEESPTAGGAPVLLGTALTQEGIAVFEDLTITGAGPVTLIATPQGASAPAASVTIDLVVPKPSFASLEFVGHADGAQVTSGVPFNLLVQALDASGNPVIDDGTPVTLYEEPRPGGPSSPVALGTQLTAYGIATFDEVVLQGLGPVTLVASTQDPSAAAASATVNVVAPTVALAVVTPKAGAAIPAGGSEEFEVEALDASGAVNTTFNGGVIGDDTLEIPEPNPPTRGLGNLGQFVAGVARVSITLPASEQYYRTDSASPMTYQTVGPHVLDFTTIVPAANGLTQTLTTPIRVNVVTSSDDFFGDGKSDLGVYGYGRYLIAEPGTNKVIDVPFGGPEDRPVTGDFFGDGVEDYGVYGYGRFIVVDPKTGQTMVQPLGGPDDIPVVGDFYNDGHDAFGVYGYGRFAIYDNEVQGGVYQEKIGSPTAVPVVGDFFGDGHDAYGLYDNGRFEITDVTTGKTINQAFGGPQDIPIVGDFFGDGVDDLGVYGYGRFLVAEQGTNKVINQPLGGPADVPVVGDFFGDGYDDFGVFGYGRYALADPAVPGKVLIQPFGGPKDIAINEAPAFLYSPGSVRAEAVASPAVGEAASIKVATSPTPGAADASGSASISPPSTAAPRGPLGTARVQRVGKLLGRSHPLSLHRAAKLVDPGSVTTYTRSRGQTSTEGNA